MEYFINLLRYQRLKIRLATKDDKHEVLRLLDELGEEVNKRIGYSPHNVEAQKLGGKIYEEIISRDDIKIFVAEENGKLIAVTTFFLAPYIRHGCYRGHIEDFVVSAKYRNRGVGSKIFTEIKKYCRKNKIPVIKLNSMLNNKPAHDFYQKNGGRFTEKMFRFDMQ